ncbi:hypothetical protein [Larkinella rosea]|uniref:DUF2264 domain-containing protein n=1 Tax=Larkinella rosea TaxID=2025312 RepID=A0A3P1BQ95_9BACT|nr:hypothetical protein [Larkinella rosea]RRB02864.1 hypothetical protein EHT25_20720 [Larkinella rosea]
MKNSSLLLFVLFIVYAGNIAAQTEAVFSKKYTYETLSTYQKGLLEDFLADEIPAGRSVADVLTNTTSLRTKTRLAEALLFRNKTGDKEKAADILSWILKNQHQDPNTKIYGIWKTSIDADKFDQNWREFIGSDLIIIRKNFGHLLPKEIVKDIESGLIHAAKGALKRNVGADYTNISMMSSFLMEYVGTEFKIDELKQAGIKKAHDVFNLYQRHHTFSEYNSPTYYGVTLVAIALWRELAFSSDMRQMGQTLEREFWHEAATFYNANLKNMPGPYFRGYGMDMRKYLSIMGIWMALVVDNEKQAPIPSTTDAPKYGEMSNLAPIFNLGLSIPKSDIAAIKRFTTPRFISRKVPNTYAGDSIKQVTAMINRDWMMGGVRGIRRSWNQVKTGTIHWKTADGDIGWLVVPGDGTTNVSVSKTTMSLYRADAKATILNLFVYAPNATTNAFSDSSWALSSMKLTIKTALKRIATEPVDPKQLEKDVAIAEAYPTIIKVVFEIPQTWDSTMPLLEITPAYFY